MDKLAEFEKLVRAKLAEAEKLFGVNLSQVEISFKLKGRYAGMACFENDKPLLRFNPQAIALNWDHMVNSTIPHEVAHTVGQVARRFGTTTTAWQIENHNHEWRKAAIALGDTDYGKRTHDLPLKASRKQNRFCYQTPSGAEIEVSATIHNRIQKGRVYRSRKTGERLRPEYVKGYAKVDTDKLLAELGI